MAAPSATTSPTATAAANVATVALCTAAVVTAPFLRSSPTRSTAGAAAPMPAATGTSTANVRVRPGQQREHQHEHHGRRVQRAAALAEQRHLRQQHRPAGQQAAQRPTAGARCAPAAAPARTPSAIARRSRWGSRSDRPGVLPGAGSAGLRRRRRSRAAPRTPPARSARASTPRAAAPRWRRAGASRRTARTPAGTAASGSPLPRHRRAPPPTGSRGS